MCACGQPNVNDQPGYRWQPNDEPMILTAVEHGRKNGMTNDALLAVMARVSESLAPAPAKGGATCATNSNGCTRPSSR